MIYQEKMGGERKTCVCVCMGNGELLYVKKKIFQMVREKTVYYPLVSPPPPPPQPTNQPTKIVVSSFPLVGFPFFSFSPFPLPLPFPPSLSPFPATTANKYPST